MPPTSRRQFLRLTAACSAALLTERKVLASESTDFSEVIDRLSSAIRRMMDQSDIPGLAISLVERDRLVWAMGFGHTDRARRLEVTADTRFSLQSVSKTYTATTVLRAISEGLLDLDDSLQRLLPGFSIFSRFAEAPAGKITLRQLLSHHAGLCHEAPLGNNYDARPCTLEEHARSISKSWLLYAPGDRHSYSNLGFDLAGYILQRKRRRSFAHCASESLLDPLGMASSTYEQAAALADLSVARGHVGSFEVSRESIPMMPAGGLYSTVSDMARFISFQLARGTWHRQQLVPPALLDEMGRPQFSVPGQVGGCGLGLFNVASLGATRLLHSGGGYGYSAHQTWIPEYGLGVAILCNQQNAPLTMLATRVLWLMVAAQRGQVPPTLAYVPIQDSEVMLRSEQLQRLEGTYRKRDGIVTVRSDGIGLELINGSVTVRLRARMATEFFAGTQRYLFDTDTAGLARALRAAGPNYAEDFVEYWPINDSPRDAAGPDLPQWREFVGRYVGSKHGQDIPITVLIKNGFLYVDWEGGLKLTEYRPRLFFTADGESVEFKHDSLTLGNRPFKKA